MSAPERPTTAALVAFLRGEAERYEEAFGTNCAPELRAAADRLDEYDGALRRCGLLAELLTTPENYPAALQSIAREVRVARGPV